jgi:hypothetical protein
VKTPLVLGAIAFAGCSGAHGSTRQNSGGAPSTGVGMQPGGGAQATGGASVSESCVERATSTQEGVDPAELFRGSGTAEFTYPDGTKVALERELRCEVLRGAQGAVVGFGAGFANSLPAIGHRAAILVASGYAGDGEYRATGEGENASVQLVVWIADEPCQPRNGCWSGTYPAQVTLQNGAHRGTAATAEGLRLEFECSADANLAPVRGDAISIMSPPPGVAYMKRAAGFVLPFVGIECSTNEATGLLTARTQPRPWSNVNAYDRGYGFSIGYQESATSDPQKPLPTHLKYDYFGIVVGGAPANATLSCGNPFAGAIPEGKSAAEDPNLDGVWFRCP